MNVRCDRCSALYGFDDSQIPAEGVSVQCSSCGHVFRVYRAAAVGAEGAAHAARWEAAPQALPEISTGAWQIGGAPVTPVRPGVAGARPDPVRERPPGGKGKWVALFVFVLLAGGAAAVYFLRPDLVQKLVGRRVDEGAVSQATSAALELEKDSYAAIERARDLYARAAALDPRYAAARAGLAQAELARAEYLLEEATDLEARVATSAPDRQPALQADIAARKKDAQTQIDRAFADGRAAVELEPDGADGLRVMADYYRLMKAPDQVAPLLQRAREQAPADPWVAYVEGASAAGDPARAERAIRYLDEALELAPGFQRARYRMARVFLALGDTARARMHAEAILKAVPDHERAKALVAELDGATAPAAEPQPAAAAAATEPKPAREPTVEQLFARGDRLRELEKPEQAVELYRKAAELAPDDPDGPTSMGWCYLDMEKYDLAIASFGRALALSPRFSDAHFGIAEAYRAKGQEREAAKHYRAYLDATPDGEDAAVARRQLEALQQ